MGDGCPVCGTAMKCTCQGRGVPDHPDAIDYELHGEDGTVIVVYVDGREETIHKARE